MNTYASHGITGIREAEGGQQRTTCPQCSHDRKKQHDRCLSVDTTKGTWFCHHCEWSGGLGKEKEDGGTWWKRPVRKFIRAPRAVVPDVLRPLPEADQPRPLPDQSNALRYLEERGITPQVVQRNKITATRHYFAGHKKEVQCIAFPFMVDGEVVNVKYRTREKDFAQSKGGGKVFYKIDDVRNETAVVITEGEIDALSWEVAKFPAAISVPDGAPNAEAENVSVKMRFLDNCIDRLEHVTRFVLATDNDPNGFRLRDELARRLGKHRCWVVEYPEGCKDSNDVLVKHGIEGLQMMYAEATLYPVEGIQDPAGLLEGLRALHTSGYPDLQSTGDPGLDERCRLKFGPGALTVITGVPGHGKSGYLDYISVRSMIRNGWRMAFYTPENHPLETHLQRMSELLIGRGVLPGPNQMQIQELEAAKNFLQRHIRYIHTDDVGFTLDNILEVAEYLVRSFGINALVLDPWNRIDHDQQKGEQETTYIGRQLHKIQSFARLHSVHAFVVAHPRKIDKIAIDDTYKIPTMYDIGGSANWFNMPDVGITVYQNFNPTTQKRESVNVYIRKVKHKFQGQTGTVEYQFDTVSNRYYQQSDPFDTGPWIDPETGVRLTSASPADQFAGRPDDW